MESFNVKIKKERIKKNISQVDMAKAAGISRSAYISFEKNDNSDNLTLKAAAGIAKALNIPFTELFEIEISGTGTNKTSGELEQLRERVKELEQRIEEKDLVIHLLKKENQQLTELQAWDTIFEELHNLIQYEISLKYGDSNENERVIIKREIEESINYLKQEVDKALSLRYIDISALLEIFVASGILMEDDVSSKEDYIKECTLFFNRFFEVKQEDVAEFIEKNEITKWDKDKLKQLGKRVKRTIRRNHIVYKRHKNSL